VVARVTQQPTANSQQPKETAMKHAVEIDMSDGPVPIASFRAALLATSHVTDATVLVTPKPSHLVMAQDSFGRVQSVVLRIEWDA